MNVLAIDLGGTHLKFCSQRHPEVVRVDSGPEMTPDKMMKALNERTVGWKYDRVSFGFPAPVVHDSPILEPFNLGKGWRTFDFSEAFHHLPFKMLNDAAMQALGAYKGGRMLFLGLGTGLGSAMVVDGVVQPMELAHLKWKRGKTYEEYLGEKARKKQGDKAWNRQVLKVIAEFSEVLECEYVTVGGGNAGRLRHLPKNVKVGSNEDAMRGAFSLWQPPTDRKAARKPLKASAA